MANRLRGLLLPVFLLIAAELYFVIGNVTSYSLAPPSAILHAGIGAFGDGSLLELTAETLFMAVSGLLIGGLIGLSLGLLFGSVSALNRLFNFTIETLRPIPPVALIPVPILILGVGYRMEISLVAFACAWPVLLSTRDALRSVEPTLHEVASILQFKPYQTITKIVLPAALGRIIVGWRVAIGLSLIVAITVEIAANPLGLGHATIRAEESLNPALALAYIVWIGILGFLISYLVTGLSNKFEYRGGGHA
jgi:NitT/TauT family transport system permease protein